MVGGREVGWAAQTSPSCGEPVMQLGHDGESQGGGEAGWGFHHCGTRQPQMACMSISSPALVGLSNHKRTHHCRTHPPQWPAQTLRANWLLGWPPATFITQLGQTKEEQQIPPERRNRSKDQHNATLRQYNAANEVAHKHHLGCEKEQICER